MKNLRSAPFSSPNFKGLVMNVTPQNALPVLSNTIDGELTQTVNLRNVHAWLESKQEYACWAKRRLSDYTQGVDYLAAKTVLRRTGSNLSSTKKEYYAPLDVALAIVVQERKNPKAPEVIAYLTDKAGYLTVIREQQRKEILFGKRLRVITQGIAQGEILEQFTVSGYRIDFYLPEHNLAIEFDERHHRNQMDDDKMRQQTIERDLDATFIRVKENSIDEGLNKILQWLFNNRL